jgi:hypothetical protein
MSVGRELQQPFGDQDLKKAMPIRCRTHFDPPPAVGFKFEGHIPK